MVILTGFHCTDNLILNTFLSLGLSIAGGRGATINRIFVVDVKPNGAAFNDGKIKSMDEILEVNHVTIRGISHHDASAILRNTPTNVHLALGRSKEVAGYMKRRSQPRDKSFNSEGSSSPSPDHGSNASLNRQAPSPLAHIDDTATNRDSPVPDTVSKEPGEPQQQNVITLVKVRALASCGLAILYLLLYFDTARIGRSI